MSSINKVTLLGRVGKDPEVKDFPNGGKIVLFSVATSEKWTDKGSGEKKERTEWHNVVIRNEGLCGVAERYLKKGSRVYIEGQLQTRRWQDQSGADRFTTETVLSGFSGQLVLLDSAPASDYADRQGAQPPQAKSVADQIGDEVPF